MITNANQGWKQGEGNLFLFDEKKKNSSPACSCFSTCFSTYP
jgi:hypothetical protein